MQFLGRVLVTRAPPRTPLRGVRVGGCGCGRTAKAAAVMTALGMTTHNGELTDASWPLHIQEERTLLFPKLAALGDAYHDLSVRQALARLEDDHRVYLALLAQDLPLPPWSNAAHSTADHAALEDLLVASYAAPLRRMAMGQTAEEARRDVSIRPTDGTASSAVGSMALAPHGGALAHTELAPRSASWAPWLLGGALGALGWWFGGPLVGLGVGLSTAGGAALVARPPTHPPAAPPVGPVPSGPPTTDNAPDPALQKFPDVDVLVDGANADAAASAALDQASQDALKQQNAEAKAAYKGLVKKIGDYVGVGDEASSWAGFLVDVSLGIGKLIKVFEGDASKAANTDYEKARMRDAMAIMIAYGFPPPSMAFEMWGAQDLANEMEEEIRVIKGVAWKTGCKTLTVVRPGFGGTPLDYSPVTRELGRSIIVAINNKTYSARTLAMFMAAAKLPGGMLYDRYFFPVPGSGWAPGEVVWNPTGANLIPAALLVAYAGAARFGMSETVARDVVARALSTFAGRWHVHVPTVDGDDPAVRCNLVALMLVDAWQAVAGYAALHRLYDGARWAARDYEPVVGSHA